MPANQRVSNASRSRRNRPTEFPRSSRSLAVVIALAGIGLCAIAWGKGKDDRGGFQAESSGNHAVAASTLSKSMALDSVIAALGANQSDAAQQTLQKAVRGEISFGGHSKQAAQLALIQLVLHPTPQSESFLVQLFMQPDDALRPPTDKTYSGSMVRWDAAHTIAKAGSSSLRLALAKLYTDEGLPAEIRPPLEEIMKSDHPANFEAQLVLLNSPNTPGAFKGSLQKSIFEKNASAVRQALKLESNPFGAGGPGGMGFTSSFSISSTGSVPGVIGPTLSLLFGAAKMFGLGGPSLPAGSMKGMPPGMPGGAPGGMAGIPGGSFSGPGISGPGLPGSGMPGSGMPGPGLPGAGSVRPGSSGSAFPGVRLPGVNVGPIQSPSGSGANNGAPMNADNGAQGGSFGRGGGRGRNRMGNAATTTTTAASRFGSFNSARTVAPAGPPPLGGALALEMMSQMMSMQPVDAAVVARELWKPQMAASLAKEIRSDKSDRSALVGALASIPLTSARNTLKDYLVKEWAGGPREFGGKTQIANANPLTPTFRPLQVAPQAQPSLTRRGKKGEDDKRGGLGNGGMGMGMGMRTDALAAPHQQLVEFGDDWFDPGALIVLKTLPYEERKKEKPKRRLTPAPQYMSAAAQKRADLKKQDEARQEARYDWRDAVQKLVHKWDERLAEAVPSAPDAEAAGEAADSKEKDAATGDDAEKSAKGAKHASDSAKKSGDAKEHAAEPAGPAPTPSAPLPFALHGGGKIAKEFHVRWPQELPGGLGGALKEHLAVHFIRLQGEAKFLEMRTHYRAAVAAAASPAVKQRGVVIREIEDGTWLDAIQLDPATHRTRSIDVVITHDSAGEEKGSRGRPEELTIDILLVEIPSLEPTTPGVFKRESRETTSTGRP